MASGYTKKHLVCRNLQKFFSWNVRKDNKFPNSILWEEKNQHEFSKTVFTKKIKTLYKRRSQDISKGTHLINPPPGTFLLLTSFLKLKSIAKSVMFGVRRVQSHVKKTQGIWRNKEGGKSDFKAGPYQGVFYTLTQKNAIPVFVFM